MKRCILGMIVLLFLGSGRSFSEELKSARMVFDQISYDFGTIQETAGDVSHTFRFTNRGTLPLVIHSVGVSCGCTYPEFSKEPLLPGKSGEMKITFDPTNRPGRFEKVISVSSNDPRGSIRLTITGEVEGRPRTIQDDYPYSVADGLRIADRNLVWGTLPRGRSTVRSVGIANGGKSVVKVGIDTAGLPAWLSVRAVKTTLAPGERSEIRLTYDASRADLWGKYRHRFGLIVNGERQPDPVEATAIFTEDFSALSRTELKLAPRADYSSFFYHFSNQPQGKPLTRQFQISNGGERDLIIRHIGRTGDRIRFKTDRTVIRAGETAPLTVTLDTKGMSGRLSEGLTVITNDPSRPAREIRVLATIE
ncbi:MAG: DUF1573 domain-containing protein [Rikenella sp.]|nr:DUF1573 domain-containing protein [Rikenella sp.]